MQGCIGAATAQGIDRRPMIGAVACEKASLLSKLPIVRRSSKHEALREENASAVVGSPRWVLGHYLGRGVRLERRTGVTLHACIPALDAPLVASPHGRPTRTPGGVRSTNHRGTRWKRNQPRRPTPSTPISVFP